MNSRIAYMVIAALVGIPMLVSASDWSQQQRAKDEERARYWKSQGFEFDADTMSAYVMDQKVKDIRRAEYWKGRGYNFDATFMTAYAMDQEVKDIQRAEYWKKQGLDFDPGYMTAYAMDEKVKDIERAEHWKSQGYQFDPNHMTAYAMDQKVLDIARASYWRARGFDFDPEYMTAYAMDKVVEASGQDELITQNITAMADGTAQAIERRRDALMRRQEMRHTDKRVQLEPMPEGGIPSTQNRRIQEFQSKHDPTPATTAGYYESRYHPSDITLFKIFFYATGSDIDYQDSTWNTELDTAVRDFQEKSGLEVDGKIGPQTLRRMSDVHLQAVGTENDAFTSVGVYFRDLAGATRHVQPEVAAELRESRLGPAEMNFGKKSEYIQTVPIKPEYESPLPTGDSGYWEALDRNYRSSIESSNLSLERNRSTFTSGDISGYSHRIGRFRFHHYTGSNGDNISGTSTRIGRTDFHDLSKSDGTSISGTTTPIGKFRFHNFSASDGTSMNGTSTRIGSFDFHDFTDSRGNRVNGTSTRIGSFEFHDYTDSNGHTNRQTTYSFGED